jgi:hypothetical protein
MARPPKPGLDYFQVDVDIYDDIKILRAEELADPDGDKPWIRFSVSAIAIRMLREIFKRGYYIEVTNDFLFSVSKRSSPVITTTLLKHVINCLAQSGFFHFDIYNKNNIITSHGIQNRYSFIIKSSNRRKIFFREDIQLFYEEKKVINNSKSTERQETTTERQETTTERQETTTERQESTHIIYPSFTIVSDKDNKVYNSINNNKEEKEGSGQETTTERQETTTERQETTTERQETTTERQETTTERQETTTERQLLK